MSDTEDYTTRDLKQAVKAFQNGMSVNEVSGMYNVPIHVVLDEDERQKSSMAKILKKKSFRYETDTLEDAVNAVLCGTSIKEAAQIYNVSKDALKEALKEEIEMEPKEEGSNEDDVDVDEEFQNGNSPGAESSSEKCTPKLAKLQTAIGQAMFDQLQSLNSKKRVASALKESGILGSEVEVTCGKFSGQLFRKKFFCPGLHSPCIKLTGTDTWVTPKQMSVMGGKASLKNWKNAIRSSGIALRTFMDAGTLDFNEHDVNCSGKCSHKSIAGGPGKYQSKINSLEKKQLGTVQQFNQAVGSSPSASARSTPNTTSYLDDASEQQEDLPPYAPLVQSLATSSPGFDILKQAQGDDLADKQPMFPSPIIKSEKDDDGDYGAAVPPLNPVVSIQTPLVPGTPLLNSHSLLSPTANKRVLGNPGAEVKQLPIMLVPTQGLPTGAVLHPEVRSSSSSSLSTPHAVSYLVQNGQIQGQVKQVGQHFILQKEITHPPPDVLQVASSFPDIETIMKDSPTFWKGIQDIGLLEDVFGDIKSKLRIIRNEMYSVGITMDNANQLSSVVTGLGLQTKLKYKLANHQVASERQNHKLQLEIDELQRKVQEHQRKQNEIKRRSHCFNQLISNKRPRLETIDSVLQRITHARTLPTPKHANTVTIVEDEPEDPLVGSQTKVNGTKSSSESNVVDDGEKTESGGEEEEVVSVTNDDSQDQEEAESGNKDEDDGDNDYEHLSGTRRRSSRVRTPTPTEEVEAGATPQYQNSHRRRGRPRKYPVETVVVKPEDDDDNDED